MPDGLPFIPNTLDDAGLTPGQFRVFCRISRRGICSESVPAMARGCRLDDDTVWKVLRSLIELGMVSKVARQGQPSLYTVTSPDRWSQPTRNGGAPETAGHVVNSCGGHPKRRGDHPPETAGHKVTSPEVTSSKVQMDRVELPEGLRTGRLVAKWSEWMLYRQ